MRLYVIMQASDTNEIQLQALLRAKLWAVLTK